MTKYFILAAVVLYIVLRYPPPPLPDPRHLARSAFSFKVNAYTLICQLSTLEPEQAGTSAQSYTYPVKAPSIC